MKPTPLKKVASQAKVEGIQIGKAESREEGKAELVKTMIANGASIE